MLNVVCSSLAVSCLPCLQELGLRSEPIDRTRPFSGQLISMVQVPRELTMVLWRHKWQRKMSTKGGCGGNWPWHEAVPVLLASHGTHGQSNDSSVLILWHPEIQRVCPEVSRSLKMFQGSLYQIASTSCNARISALKVWTSWRHNWSLPGF